MENIEIQYYKTTLGELIIGSFNDKLCLCDWKYRKGRDSVDHRIKNFLKVNYLEQSSPVIEKTIFQLEEYINKKRESFSIPLILCGSEFQKSVWKELAHIPYGKTYTYLQLSKNLKNIKAIRAIASANGANAISIIIPCHRIIGSNGDLVGYAGGLATKRKLLQIESSYFQESLF